MDGLSLHKKKLKGKNVRKRRNITSGGAQSVGQGPMGGGLQTFQGVYEVKTLFMIIQILFV